MSSDGRARHEANAHPRSELSRFAKRTASSSEPAACTLHPTRHRPVAHVRGGARPDKSASAPYAWASATRSGVLRVISISTATVGGAGLNDVFVVEVELVDQPRCRRDLPPLGPPLEHGLGDGDFVSGDSDRVLCVVRRSRWEAPRLASAHSGSSPIAT